MRYAAAVRVRVCASNVRGGRRCHRTVVAAAAAVARRTRRNERAERKAE